jgi:iron complex outermembrane receptor protein
MSLQELMAVEVTSVARRPQRAEDAPAALSVLTAEELERSGVTTVPDALRLVPGVQVARVSSNVWAVSIRGFNGRFSNKLLVLIDGRSVYNTLLSGVFWSDHDLPIDDIARIEVIRGPGAALWGSNAVNGVINIITKPARETQGTRFSVSSGNLDPALATLRYGGTAGDTAYRLSFKGRLRSESELPDGTGADDVWRKGALYFRSDTDLGADRLTVQAGGHLDALDQRVDLIRIAPPGTETETGTAHSTGGYLLGRWRRDLGSESSLQVQGSYDHSSLEDLRIAEQRDVFDLQLQHDFAFADRHQLVWGAGYRISRSQIDDTDQIMFAPDDRTLQQVSAFVQDTITLVPDTLDLTLGTKIEHTEFTDFNLQPNARALWRPARGHTLWASVSRAVRTPSQAEHDGTVRSGVLQLPATPPAPAPPPILFLAHGSSSVENEVLTAYEAGWRVRPTDDTSLDVAAFYNDYDNLVTASAGTPSLQLAPAPHTAQPFVLHNGLEGATYGTEVAGTWQASEKLRLSASYSYLQTQFDAQSAGLPGIAEALEGIDPEHQAVLRAAWDPHPEWRIDGALRYVDELPTFDIESYLGLDLRVGWRPVDGLELALTGRNLLEPTHLEFGEDDLLPARSVAVERSVLFTLTARF